MTKPKIRDIIIKLHFYLLGFALLNFALKNTVELSLNNQLTYVITILIYMSGFVLFFWNLKPFKKLAFYFSIYIITPILTLLFWMFGGIFFGLITSILLYPIYPNEIKAENDEIVVYTKYHGFMGACCTYALKEKKYYIFEKKITEIILNELSVLETELISSENGKIEWRIKHEKYDDDAKKFIVTDTIIPIK